MADWVLTWKASTPNLIGGECLEEPAANSNTSREAKHKDNEADTRKVRGQGILGGSGKQGERVKPGWEWCQVGRWAVGKIFQSASSTLLAMQTSHHTVLTSPPLLPQLAYGKKLKKSRKVSLLSLLFPISPTKLTLFSPPTTCMHVVVPNFIPHSNDLDRDYGAENAEVCVTFSVEASPFCLCSS